MSYYEQLCRKLGVRIPFYVAAVRNADKNDARKRRVLSKKPRAGKRSANLG